MPTLPNPKCPGKFGKVVYLESIMYLTVPAFNTLHIDLAAQSERAPDNVLDIGPVFVIPGRQPGRVKFRAISGQLELMQELARF